MEQVKHTAANAWLEGNELDETRYQYAMYAAGMQWPRRLPGETLVQAIHRTIAETQAKESARREALGPQGRAWEDYGRRWAEMARGER